MDKKMNKEELKNEMNGCACIGQLHRAVEACEQLQKLGEPNLDDRLKQLSNACGQTFLAINHIATGIRYLHKAGEESLVHDIYKICKENNFVPNARIEMKPICMPAGCDIHHYANEATRVGNSKEMMNLKLKLWHEELVAKACDIDHNKAGEQIDHLIEWYSY
jgi:hypothetical protein